MPEPITLSNLATAIKNTADSGYLSLVRARNLARVAYSGWRGWYHVRHWRTDDYLVGVRQIRDEASQEAAAMREQISELEDRIVACDALAELCQSAIDDWVNDQEPSPSRRVST